MSRSPVLANAWRLLRIYYHYRRLSTDLPYSPIFAGIETTGLCNLRCKMCPHGQERYAERKRGHMQFEVFKRTVDQMKGFVYDADLFGGGEPLLNPHIYEMIAYAKAAGIKTRLHTNATVLDSESARSILRSGLDFISFSFEGYSKTMYESTRVNASYEETYRNILQFLKMKRELGSERPYTVLQVIRVNEDSEKIRSGLRSLHQQFAEHPALNEFSVIPLHNYGGKVGRPNHVDASYTPCTFLWYATYFLWDGTIVPCCVDWWGDYPLGNIKDSTILEAWNGAKMQELRCLIASRRYKEVPLCADCDRLWRARSLGVPIRSLKAMWKWLSQHLFGY